MPIEKNDIGTEYTVFALPYAERKSRAVLFEHRPKQDVGEHTTIIARKYNMQYTVCVSDKDIKGCDCYLICGAGILSPKCVKDKKIINCHPGIIPQVRGLDSFKWAIFNKIQVGNTLLFIDENVDEGEIIVISETPVYKSDTLRSFADRHYEREIEMLGGYERYIRHSIAVDIKNTVHESKNPIMLNANKRMPIAQEKILVERFEKYKGEYGL